MNFDKQQHCRIATVFIGSLVGLVCGTSCELIIGDLCSTTVCDAESATPFGGTGGSAGAGGDAATGGVAGTGGDAGSGNVVTGGGGTGGMGGTTTAGGGGTGGTGCDASHKDCGGDCVLIDDPLYGCGPVDCEPCIMPNATAKCSQGACDINACDSGFDDCANGPSDGCEQDLLSDPDNCGGCDQPCTDYTAQPCQAGKCNPGCGTDNVPVSTEGYSLCLTIETAQHSPGLTLAIGGQYTDSGDQAVSVFPFPGCSAPSSADDQVVCDDLDLKPGTALRVLNGYVGPYFLCDASTFPSHCTGNVTLYKDGVQQQASAEHPLDATDAPWVYEVGAGPMTYWMFKYPVVP